MAMNSATILMQIATDLTSVKKAFLTATLNSRNEVLLKLQDRIEGFAAKEKLILANRTLSDEGKRAQMATLGTDALPSFSFLRRVVEGLEQSAASRRTALQLDAVESPETTDATVQYLRGQEIRNSVRAYDEATRRAVFLRAAEADKAEVLWAMLTDPMGEMVGEEDKTRALAARAERLQPESYKQYEQIKLLLEYLTGVRGWVAGMLKTAGVEPKQIAAALGGSMVDTRGTPDGQARLEGALLAQRLAAAGAAA